MSIGLWGQEIVAVSELTLPKQINVQINNSIIRKGNIIPFNAIKKKKKQYTGIWAHFQVVGYISHN